MLNGRNSDFKACPGTCEGSKGDLPLRVQLAYTVVSPVKRDWLSLCCDLSLLASLARYGPTSELELPESAESSKRTRYLIQIVHRPDHGP